MVSIFKPVDVGDEKVLSLFQAVVVFIPLEKDFCGPGTPIESRSFIQDCKQRKVHLLTGRIVEQADVVQVTGGNSQSLCQFLSGLDQQ